MALSLDLKPFYGNGHGNNVLGSGSGIGVRPRMMVSVRYMSPVHARVTVSQVGVSEVRLMARVRLTVRARVKVSKGDSDRVLRCVHALLILGSLIGARVAASHSLSPP